MLHEVEEGPVHEVALDPFFLSKYEMTQGQWLTFTGKNPSRYKPGGTFGDKRHTLSDASACAYFHT